MADYGYADIGKLADFANNTIGGLTANDIMRFPRANVPPVKQGRWICTNDYETLAYDTLYYNRCSACGEESLETGDFCPNCGARMLED